MGDLFTQPKVSTQNVYKNVADLIQKERPIEPVYCLYVETLNKTVQHFLTQFPGRTMYAVKANDTPLLISAMYEAGMRDFDTASIPEIALVSELCPEATCYFMAPVKLPGAAREAYWRYGVRHFVVDHHDALTSLLGEISARDITIFVRMEARNEDALYDLSSKFGAKPDETITLLKAVAASGATPALAFNVGSLVRKPEAYGRALKVCRAVLAQSGVSIRFVDVGGGFPVSYPGIEVPSLNEFFEQIGSVSSSLTLPKETELLAEPGRALVAPSMSTVTQVLLRKGRRLYLNDGMFGAFWDLAKGGIEELPSRTFREGALLEGRQEAFTLYGPTCCSTDKFPKAMTFPASIKAGDWIEFGMMGAYSMAGRTRFNGFYSDRVVKLLRPEALLPQKT